MLDLALQEFHVGRARLALVVARQRQHLVGHVQAVGAARGADALGRQQHVDAAARAQVQHHLAGAQLGQRRRVAAAQRRQHGGLGQAAGLHRVVQVARDGVGSGQRAGGAAGVGGRGHGAAAGGGSAALRDAARRLTVLFLDDLLDVLGLCHRGSPMGVHAWATDGPAFSPANQRCCQRSARATSAIITGTSTSGPMTAANAAPEWMP